MNDAPSAERDFCLQSTLAIDAPYGLRYMKGRVACAESTCSASLSRCYLESTHASASIVSSTVQLQDHANVRVI